jgi:hypothetical protein
MTRTQHQQLVAKLLFYSVAAKLGMNPVLEHPAMALHCKKPTQWQQGFYATDNTDK